ncbi:MAG: DUF3237 domain-containing protein [Clostridiales bacterium]|nr:DUF3237 domain-containing protein [Clostridiales bacterium]
MIQLKKLFDIQLEQKQDIEMPATCRGDLLISPTTGGSFCGDKLNGKVMPVGMGLTYTPAPCQNEVKAEMLLEMEDGDKAMLCINAVLDIDSEEEEKLIRGEKVDPERYYYKGTANFITGATKYKWLERKICVCNGCVDDWTKVSFSIYMI